MTLYEGSAADGDLSELASERIDPLPDSDSITLPFDTGQTGTFYLEMSKPEETPTWWWHRGEDGLVDVGGTTHHLRIAFVPQRAESVAEVWDVVVPSVASL